VQVAVFGEQRETLAFDVPYAIVREAESDKVTIRFSPFDGSPREFAEQAFA
jgi:hypothetical protein